MQSFMFATWCPPCDRGMVSRLVSRQDRAESTFDNGCLFAWIGDRTDAVPPRQDDPLCPPHAWVGALEAAAKNRGRYHGTPGPLRLVRWARCWLLAGSGRGKFLSSTLELSKNQRPPALPPTMSPAQQHRPLLEPRKPPIADSRMDHRLRR